MYLRITPNTGRADELVLVNSAGSTGYGVVTPGWMEAMFGSPSLSAEFLTGPSAPPSKVQDVEEPRTFDLEVRVKGDGNRALLISRYRALQRAVTLLQEHGGRIRYKGTRATSGIDLVVMHVDMGRAWSHEAEVTDNTTIDLSVTCQPFALLDPMDLDDNFRTDTLGAGGLYNNEGADWIAGIVGELLPHDARENEHSGWWAGITNMGGGTSRGSGNSVAPVNGTFYANVGPSVAGGDVVAGLDTPWLPRVVVGRSYTFSSYFLTPTTAPPGTTPRLVRTGIQWLNASNVVLSTSQGTNVQANTSTWVQATCTATAPTGAVKARPIMTVVGVAAAGETHLADAASFTLNAATIPDVLTVNTSEGAMVQSASGHKANSILIHAGSPHTFADAMIRARIRFGDMDKQIHGGVVVKWVDANNYIEAYLDDNITNTRLRIDAVVAGYRTNVASVNLTARLVDGDEVDLRGYITGNMVAAVAWKNYVQPLHHHGVPSGTDGISISPTILPTEAMRTALGASVQGRGGVAFGMMETVDTTQVDSRITGFRIRPWTFPLVWTARRSPYVQRLNGAIPGDAPALVDFVVGSEASLAGHLMFAWQPAPRRPNMADGLVRNPWSAAVRSPFTTGVITSATSQHTDMPGFRGARSYKLVTGGGDQGVHRFIPGHFERGRTYRATARVRALTGTQPVRIKLGTDNDYATGTQVNLNTTWQEISVEWTPTNHRHTALVAITSAPSAAQTWYFSDVTVIDKAIGGAPAVDELNERVPPWGDFWAPRYLYPTAGLIESGASGAAGIEAFRGSWASPSAAYIASGAISSADPQFQIPVNPGALRLPPNTTVPVQVWIWYSGEPTREVTAMCGAYKGSFSSIRWSVEHGSAGIALPKPTSGIFPVKRHQMIGTVLVDTGSDPDAETMIAIYLSSASGAEFAIERIGLIPSDRVITSPYGEISANIARTIATQRRIAWDGTGAQLEGSQSGRAIPESYAADVGLFGAPIKFDPGVEHEILTWMGGVTPNSPNGVTTGGEANAFGYDHQIHVAVQPRVAIGA